MSIHEQAEHNFETLFHNKKSRFETLDPELAEFYVNFAYGEVVADSRELDAHTRLMVQLAALIANGSEGMYKVMLEAALNVGVTAVEIKEILYQASAYVGMGRVYDFLHITNNELLRRDYKLPLPGQATTTPETRASVGAQIQRATLGDHALKTLSEGIAQEAPQIFDFITNNLFGDIYSREGIQRNVRELITLSMLVALGDCDTQLRAHVTANLNVGNSRSLLITTVIQLLPLIGYPRTINGLRIVSASARGK